MGPFTNETYLATLRDNALAASTDDKNGDRWHRSHSCVLSAKYTVFYATSMFSGYHFEGHPGADNQRAGAHSRFAATAHPAAVVALVDEVRRLREQLAALQAGG